MSYKSLSAKSIDFFLFFFDNDSVRCVVGVQHQAVTQVKRLGAESVRGWVTAGPRPAYRSAEWQVIFSETVDWGQTL